MAGDVKFQALANLFLLPNFASRVDLITPVGPELSFPQYSQYDTTYKHYSVNALTHLHFLIVPYTDDKGRSNPNNIDQIGKDTLI